MMRIIPPMTLALTFAFSQAFAATPPVQEGGLSPQSKIQALDGTTEDLNEQDTDSGPNYRFTSGVDYAQGKFGDGAVSRVTTFNQSLDIAYQGFKTELVVPFLIVSGPAGVIPGVTVEPSDGQAAAPGKKLLRGGNGDVQVSTLYQLWDYDDAFALSVGGRIKFGTASFRLGLGTGKNDYAPMAEVIQHISAWTLSETVGYSFNGSPVDTPLRNTVFAGLTTDYQWNDKTNVGLNFNTQSRIAAGPAGSPERIAAIYYARQILPDLTLQFNLTKGFSDSSPDFGGGTSIAVDF